MWNQRLSPLNRRACYEKNTIMLNKTKRFVCCPGITLDIILTVATDFIVHIIIHFEFSMFFQPHKITWFTLPFVCSLADHISSSMRYMYSMSGTRHYERHANSVVGPIPGITRGTRLSGYHIRRDTDPIRVPMVDPADYAVPTYGTVGANSSRDL